MRTGTIRVHHRNRTHPRLEGTAPRRRKAPQSRTKPAEAPFHFPPSEVRAGARDLRELLLWDLREAGYTFREIGLLFGTTKQRASQIERKMILRAASRALKRPLQLVRPAMNPLCELPEMWMRAVTKEEFEVRLARINRFYQEQFDRIIERGYKRQRLSKNLGGAQTVSEFWRVWPFIESYERRPFSFSKLVTDFPQLTYEPHLAQLLCRLRKTGLLRNVEMTRVQGHSRPEVVMAEAPVEQHVAAAIDRLVARWSEKLRRLQMTRRPYRTNRPIGITRQWLIDLLVGAGVPKSQIEEVFPFRTAGSNALVAGTRS